MSQIGRCSQRSIISRIVAARYLERVLWSAENLQAISAFLVAVEERKPAIGLLNRDLADKTRITKRAGERFFNRSRHLRPSSQTMRDQSGRALEKLFILIAERIHLGAFGIEHANDAPLFVSHRHNDLGSSGVKRWQVTFVFMNIADHDGLSRLQSRAA